MPGRFFTFWAPPGNWAIPQNTRFILFAPSGRAVPLILHPHRLALGARHFTRRFDGDRAGHPDHRLEVTLHIPRLLRACRRVARRISRALDLDRHGVERPVAREHDLIVRGKARETDQRRLDLRWIDVDAANDEHVVVAAGDPLDAHMGAPARAWFVGKARDIAGAIAHHRQRLLGERGDDKLAGFAYRQGSESFGIDDLEQEVVLPAVQAVLRQVALGRDARAENFREPVDVDCLDAETG